MSDHVVVSNLAVLGRHGVLAEERQRAQPFEVDIDVELDLAEAAGRDDLAATLDYGELCAEVARLVEDESFLLLEALADAIATAVLGHGRVRAVTVEVRKPRPPLPHHLDAVAVRLRRERGRPQAEGRPGERQSST